MSLGASERLSSTEMSWREMKTAFQLLLSLFRVRIEHEDGSLLEGMFSVCQFVWAASYGCKCVVTWQMIYPTCSSGNVKGRKKS